MTAASRRIVAAAGPDGRSCVVSEDLLPAGGGAGMSVAVIATGPIGRIDNAAPMAAGFPDFAMAQLTDAVWSMLVAEYPPGMGREDPGMHFTETADHFLILEGECVLVLEAGEATLRAGDIGICRGAVHGWRNEGAVPCRLVTFILPAYPLERGA